MLKQRVITAVILMAIVLTCLSIANIWPMLLLLSVMIGCTYWEWLRLAKLPNSIALAMSGVLTLLLIYLGWLLLQPTALFLPVFFKYCVGLSVLFWFLIAPVTVYKAALPAIFNHFVLVLLGTLLLIVTWYSLLWLFVYEGPVALVSLWALVWCADIAAYFTGKAYGKHKLAPKVSPGKTWQGAFGGVIAAVLWLVLTAIYIPTSFGALFLNKFNWPSLVLVGLVLAAWSIIGDLFESILKRSASVKDSSNLLPGHGGVYDRIDAVLPVAPMAILFFIF